MLKKLKINCPVSAKAIRVSMAINVALRATICRCARSRLPVMGIYTGMTPKGLTIVNSDVNANSPNSTTA